MNIAKESEVIAKWLHQRIDGLATPSDERHRGSGSCFDVVLDHQTAISILLHTKMYASAFALSRCVFEAYVRGLWLAHCASEEEISKYWKGKFEYTFQGIINEIEKIETYSSGVISEAKNSNWNFFNGLTHTGSDQILRRNTEGHIEPNYEEQEIIAVARFVNSIALLAGIEIVNLAKSRGNMEALENEFTEKIKSYGNMP